MRWRVAVGLGVVALLAALAAVGAESPRITVVDFGALTALIDLGQPYLLIDARIPETYRDGHLPTAINIPGYLFNHDDPIAALPDDRDRILITYCSGGHCGVADFVGERLLDRGYRHVFVYQEGVEGWRAHGQLLITKRHEDLPTISKPDFVALVQAGSPIRVTDARSAVEFQGPTIPGAVSLPLDGCRAGGDRMPPSRDMLVVVYGQSRWDARPYHLADCLLGYGYQKVRVFAGGLADWQRH